MFSFPILLDWLGRQGLARLFSYTRLLERLLQEKQAEIDTLKQKIEMEQRKREEGFLGLLLPPKQNSTIKPTQKQQLLPREAAIKEYMQNELNRNGLIDRTVLKREAEKVKEAAKKDE